ncbi:MAG: flagellar basal body-associated FliL family protein, partial [Bacillota bacterium]
PAASTGPARVGPTKEDTATPKGAAGEPGVRPGGQPKAGGSWQVPDRPSNVMSARDLRATQKERQSRAKPGGRRIAALALAGAAVVCLAAAGGVLVYTGRLPGRIASDPGKAPVPKPGPMYAFEPFIVNVAGTNGTRYLKVSLSVECADRKTSSDIARAEYVVRDAILEVLSAQTLEDLTDVSRRNAVRQQVAAAIEQALSSGKQEPARVNGVYFLEFVIQ